MSCVSKCWLGPSRIPSAGRLLTGFTEQTRLDRSLSFSLPRAGGRPASALCGTAYPATHDRRCGAIKKEMG
jgi:hypothetical protein